MTSPSLPRTSARSPLGVTTPAPFSPLTHGVGSTQRKDDAMRNHTGPHPRIRTERHGARQGRTRPASLAGTAIAISGLLVVGSPAGSAAADPPEREHTVTTSPAEGRFR